jgi:hypothetical protein
MNYNMYGLGTTVIAIMLSLNISSKHHINHGRYVMKERPRFSVSLSFESIKFPPFQDIVLLGRRCPQGKAGVSQCLNLLEPDKFDLVEVDDHTVEAILVNKAILKRLPVENVVEVLKDKVFPFVTNGETVQVDFNVRIHFDAVEGTLENST